jgi:hypothetical protein
MITTTVVSNATQRLELRPTARRFYHEETNLAREGGEYTRSAKEEGRDGQEERERGERKEKCERRE